MEFIPRIIHLFCLIFVIWIILVIYFYFPSMFAPPGAGGGIFDAGGEAPSGSNSFYNYGRSQ